MAYGDDTDFGNSPVGADDILVNLGLVDVASGRALPTDDWSPAQEARSARSATATREIGDTDEDDADDEGDDGEPESQDAPVSQQSTQVRTPAKTNWDSDDNPYKKQYDELQQRVGSTPDPAATARQNFAQTEATLAAQKEAAYAGIVANGINGQAVAPAIARILVDSLHEKFLTEARMQADRSVLLPVAKQAVAADIAKKHSVGGVTISVDDLMKEPTQEAMVARARTLQEVGRDTKFKARRNARTDRVEGSGNRTTSVPAGALDDISPGQRISLGLRRGQLRDEI